MNELPQIPMPGGTIFWLKLMPDVGLNGAPRPFSGPICGLWMGKGKLSPEEMEAADRQKKAWLDADVIEALRKLDVHMRPSDAAAVCEAHHLQFKPGGAMARYLVIQMRLRHGIGGYNVCYDCIQKARHRATEC